MLTKLLALRASMIAEAREYQGVDYVGLNADIERVEDAIRFAFSR